LLVAGENEAPAQAERQAVYCVTGSEHLVGAAEPFPGEAGGQLAASELIVVGGPPAVAVLLGILEEFLPERLVVLPPPGPALLGFFWGQRLRGQAGIVGVLRPDLDVDVAEDPAVMTDRALRDPQVPVRQSYDKRCLITLDAIAPVEIQHDP